MTTTEILVLSFYVLVIMWAICLRKYKELEPILFIALFLVISIALHKCVAAG